MTSLATSVDDKEAEAQLFGTVRRRGVGGREPGAAAFGRASRRGRAHRRPRCHPARTAGRPPRHLRRSNADLGRRRSCGAPDPGEAARDRTSSWSSPRTSPTTGSRGSRATSARSACRGGCSCSTIRAGPTSSGTSRRSAAGRTRQRSRPPAPRIAAVRIDRHSRLSGERAAEEAPAARGRSVHVRGVAARPRSARARSITTQGLLEARIRARRLPIESAGQAQDGTPPERRVVLEYRITRGPSTQLVVRGIDASGRRPRSHRRTVDQRLVRRFPRAGRTHDRAGPCLSPGIPGRDRHRDRRRPIPRAISRR